MLSRTAQGLYWMSRYVERAENNARLLDAGRRIEGLPGAEAAGNTEWPSIIIAAGCRETFGEERLDEADRDSATFHLAFDPENSSSILSCFAAARENARAMRGAVTSEVWTAINGTWSELRKLDMKAVDERRYADFIESVLGASFHFRGAINATLLRDERLWFIELGKHIERADATARMLDVKYHVLLPKTDEVGAGLDLLQWQQILRAANALRAFRHVYREQVSAPRVVDLLVVNSQSPRSLRYTYEAICDNIDNIGVHTKAQRAVADHAREIRDRLRVADAHDIIDFGLHEWLTDMIMETNKLANALGESYGFFSQVDRDAADEEVEDSSKLETCTQ
ncbi:alpha-E domain-containing protein [Donghicola mangrovi]|uniref:Alpha-E domain-containing protein n=1 Tax=Donghicola mangrovi TaxID=2729614 RepID=A0A850Q6L3_9RHOB|nr:alpha-E domain-containing protein [Donghicola mangrovi]NVO24593.1 alpha-E domain-containing protein [Donghicola mangrovi]